LQTRVDLSGRILAVRSLVTLERFRDEFAPSTVDFPRTERSLIQKDLQSSDDFPL
jgi:hypothetical protein